MSVLLTPLIDRLRLVAAIQLAVTNPPDLHIDSTGLAGNAEFLPTDNTMNKIIYQVLGNIMVLSLRMVIKFGRNVPWYNTCMPGFGIFCVKVKSGYGFEVLKRLVQICT